MAHEATAGRVHPLQQASSMVQHQKLHANANDSKIVAKLVRLLLAAALLEEGESLVHRIQQLFLAQKRAPNTCA
jgi:hypothetical protein